MSSKNFKVPRRKSAKEKAIEYVKSNFKSILVVIFVVVLGSLFPEYVKLRSILPMNFKLVAENSQKLRYWNICHATWNENGNLRTMNRVFERLGYENVNASNGDDWDVLWTFEYPYDHEDRSPLYDPIYSKPLKPHQKLNHVPGISIVTNKSFMNTYNRHFDFIMPTFHEHLQEEFKEYVKINPDKKFIEKSFTNRGVKIVDKKNIKFNKPNTLYQTFMDKPFLIDGHAFDMGICELINHFLACTAEYFIDF
jgi:tubulin monoglycylase TTLL15